MIIQQAVFMMRFLFLLGVFCCLATTADARSQSMNIVEHKGPPVTEIIGPFDRDRPEAAENVAHRKWFVGNLEEMPVELKSCGLTPFLDDQGAASLVAECEILANQDVSAVEINFYAFNHFGKVINGHRSSMLRSLAAGETATIGEVRLFISIGDVLSFGPSLAYISKVATSDGTIHRSSQQFFVRAMNAVGLACEYCSYE